MSHIERMIHVAEARIATFEHYLVSHERLTKNAAALFGDWAGSGLGPQTLEALHQSERALLQVNRYLKNEKHSLQFAKRDAVEKLAKRLHDLIPRLGKLTVLNAKEGDRVVAKCTVYDLPGVAFDINNESHRILRPDHIHAEPKDTGVVVHAEPGIFPTVQFDLSGTATMVNDDEAMLL